MSEDNKLSNIDEIEGDVLNRDSLEDNAVLYSEENEKSRFSVLGAGLAMYAAVSTLAFFVINTIAGLINPDVLKSSLFLNIAGICAYYLCALPVLLFVLSKGEKRKTEKSRVTASTFAVCFIVGFGLMGIGGYIGDWISALLGPTYTNSSMALMDSDNIWLTVLFVVILAPIGEEFVYRKLVIDRLGRYGGALAVVVSSVIFALAHGNLYQFFYALFVGVVLGYLYQASGKLYLTVLLHAAFNFFGSIVPIVLQNARTRINAEILLFEGLGITPSADFSFRYRLVEILVISFLVMRIACMICAALLPIILYKRINVRKGEISVPAKRIIPVSVLNIGIISMLLIYVTNIIIGIVY